MNTEQVCEAKLLEIAARVFLHNYESGASRTRRSGSVVSRRRGHKLKIKILEYDIAIPRISLAVNPHLGEQKDKSNISHISIFSFNLQDSPVDSFTSCLVLLVLWPSANTSINSRASSRRPL